jgi:hypothetical protein
VGPGTSLNTVVKGKIPCPCRESNPGRPARSLDATPTELSWLGKRIIVTWTDVEGNETLGGTEEE